MYRRTLIAFAVVFASLQLLSPSPSDRAGLRYEHRSAEGPLSIHILEVDPHILRMESVRALDDGIGRETVSSIAQRKGALAAVNAGFFRIGGRYDGEPEGILRIGSQWFSDPAEARGAVGWAQGGRIARIGRLLMTWQLKSRGKVYPVDGINRPRGDAEAILYAWAFHRNTLTDPGGIEFLISGGRIRGLSHLGNAGIPVDGYVYSLGSKSKIPANELSLNADAKVSYDLKAVGDTAYREPPPWQTMDYIVGGMPALLSQRRTIFEPNEEKMRTGFAEEKHPRTAVGLRADGTWVFVVVDGRQPQLSIGVSLKELTEILIALGCVDALNLDGGGSSTLIYRGEVMNSPSENGRERPVSDAIVILPR